MMPSMRSKYEPQQSPTSLQLNHKAQDANAAPWMATYTKNIGSTRSSGKLKESLNSANGPICTCGTQSVTLDCPNAEGIGQLAPELAGRHMGSAELAAVWEGIVGPSNDVSTLRMLQEPMAVCLLDGSDARAAEVLPGVMRVRRAPRGEGSSI